MQSETEVEDFVLFAMSPPEKKKRKRLHEKKSSSLVLQFSSLPHELVVSCLARVSKSYYPTLSLVSNSFRSILASPEVYQTRSLLNRTESFLYVCLTIHPDPSPRWFTLCRKPNRTPSNHASKKTEERTIGKTLVPISSPSTSAEALTSSPVVVGSDIYEIGGIINNYEPSSSVSILDCRSHTWREGPRMQVERDYPSANVVDGKIYVVGGRKNRNFSSWIEVFNPNTQTWTSLSSHGAKISDRKIIDTSAIDGKLYMYGRKGVVYNPKDGSCEPVESKMCQGLENSPFCVISNVLFCYDHYEGVFKWYDTKVRKWRKLKGLKELPKFPSDSYVLADHGGKMVVLSDEHVRDHENIIRRTRIWCAEIALERCSNEDEISGKVVWFDVVLDVPFRYDIVSALAATV